MGPPQEEVQGPAGDGQQKGSYICVQQKMEGKSSQPHCNPAPAQLARTETLDKAPETCDKVQNRSRRDHYP